MKYFWKRDNRLQIIVTLCSIISLTMGSLTLIWLKTDNVLGILLLVLGTIQLICGLSLIAIKCFKIKNSYNLNNNTITGNENPIE